MAPGRAFIAIYPPTPVVELLSDLDRTDSGVRWVPAHQWHVTVRFLGDRVDVDRVDEHLRTTFRHSQVEASLGPAVGHFGCEILHVPVVGVEALATAVDEALVPLVGPRQRPFVGHLTLGRSRRAVGRLPLVGDPAAASFTVDSIDLVRSELTPDGAHHERVGTYLLSASS
jgi:2'-5' RNA ligase